MITSRKRNLLSLTLAGVLLAQAPAEAANWLMLQGTEPASASARAKLWGFIQVQYQKDFSDPFVSGSNEMYVPPKLIGPNLEEQGQFNINRARIGVRGSNFPLDSKTNYFFLVEMGNNGITHGNGGFAHITDASVTFNHIKGARIRAGLFKTPGAEEGLQAIHVFDWINFTQVTNQLMLERFPAVGDSNAAAPTDLLLASPNLNRYSNPVGAFRDVGVQVFDTFRQGDWEHSYAVMYGNGSGLNASNGTSEGNWYLYWASEKVFSGKGGRREGWKSFAWYHTGERANASDRTQTQDRVRWGVGSKYLKKPFRATFEYMQGKGMIFQGQHRPGHVFNDLEAQGWYLEGAWYIPGSNWELGLRYDSYTRDENHPASSAGDETTYRTVTVGSQYHFNKKTRLTAEYAVRNFGSDTVKVDNQLKDVGGRFAVQITAIF